jgi:hypothetical protein
MRSYLFGTYYYLEDLVKIIDEIDKDRRKMKVIGEDITSTFAEDLKLKLKLSSA